MRVAILDDYQNIALTIADWSHVRSIAQVTSFNDHLTDQNALAHRLEPFDILVVMRERTPFSKSLIDRLPNLKLIVTSGMRNAGIDLDAATARGVLVCGTDNVGFTTAEHTWALILSLARHIPQEDRATRNGKWQTSLGISLHGKTLGVVGLGKVGGHVAKIGLAFGMNVVAWSQNLTPERCAEHGVQYRTKEELLASADIVSIHVIFSDRTRGLIGAAELARMKPTAYLINTSRGPVVTQQALIDALLDKAIAGAGIDVFDIEPLPVGHPLLGLEGVIVTPHLGYVTDANYSLWYQQCAEDVWAWLDDRPIRVLNRNKAR